MCTWHSSCTRVDRGFGPVISMLLRFVVPCVNEGGFEVFFRLFDRVCRHLGCGNRRRDTHSEARLRTRPCKPTKQQQPRRAPTTKRDHPLHSAGQCSIVWRVPRTLPQRHPLRTLEIATLRRACVCVCA
jgi:hypothetical protein